MNEKTRAKLGKMNIDRTGLLQLAVFLGKLEVCRYFVEELGFDVDCSGTCEGACFSHANNLIELMFLFMDRIM